MRLPNRRHKMIRDGYTSLHAAETSQKKLKVLDGLCIRVHEAAQFDTAFKERAARLECLRKSLREL